MKTGRRPLPTATLKLTGRFREDRHGGRADAAPAGGRPAKPQMADVASALWDQVVPGLIERNLVAEKDSAQLASMCELWGLYRASYSIALQCPTDKEARCAVTGYWTAFDRVASKFGLTPSDYASLKVPEQNQQSGLSTRRRAQ